jgi:hypothetical protein
MLHMHRLLMPSKVQWQNHMTGMESKSRHQVYCVQNETNIISELTEARGEQGGAESDLDTVEASMTERANGDRTRATCVLLVDEGLLLGLCRYGLVGSVRRVNVILSEKEFLLIFGGSELGFFLPGKCLSSITAQGGGGAIVEDEEARAGTIVGDERVLREIDNSR